MRTWLWLGLLIAVGCKTAVGPGSGLPGAPASTTEQDALWALAPDAARVGVVVSPRGVAQVERAGLAFLDLLAAAPELAPLHGEVTRALQDSAGTPEPRLASFGLSHDQGAALFVIDSSVLVAVLPLGDRDVFLARVHGTRGKDEDRIGSAFCRSLHAHYVCASARELFDGLGHSTLPAVLRAAGARGDVELAGRKIPGGDAPELAVVAQLDRGALVVRGRVTGVPPAVVAMLGAASSPRGDAAGAAGFGVIDLAPLLANLPAIPVAPSVTAVDLARSIAGPATFTVPAGTSNLDLRIPLGDPAAVTAVLGQCGTLPMLAALHVTATGGTCHVPIPPLGVTLDLRLDGKELRVATQGASPPLDVPQTALGALIAHGAWSVGFYGRGSVFAAQLSALPLAAQLPSEGKVALRALSLLSELGVGIRRDGDAVELVLGARTIWANPDDVVHKLVAISPDQVIAGGAPEAARSIAAAHPGAPFAADLRAGIGGGVALAAPLGVVAAVAIPAFMDYMKRSKKTEAELQLNKIGKTAKRAFSETSTYPVGAVGLTPGATCCGGPNGHCVSPASAWQHPVWQALDFQIDEPHLYRYSYRSDGKTFTATAVGDLDCDGVEVTYELRGTSDGGTPAVTLTRPPPNAD